jgi:transcriptional regulator with XRE-family HTH domain
MDSNEFGELLSIFRKQKGLTQLDLSNRIYDLGYPIDTSTISKYESGARTPSARFIPYFSKALGLTKAEERALLDTYIEYFRINAMESYLEGKESV